MPTLHKPFNQMQEYPNFLAAIEGVCEKWCQQNGYTEPFCRNGEYWAFPPNGAIPVKIRDIIQTDKRQAQLFVLVVFLSGYYQMALCKKVKSKSLMRVFIIDFFFVDSNKHKLYTCDRGKALLRRERHN